MPCRTLPPRRLDRLCRSRHVPFRLGLVGLLSVVCALCVVCGACTPYTYYTVPESEWNELSPRERADVRKSIRPCTVLTDEAQNATLSDQCDLAIIEFDDQGEFWKPKQLDDTLDLIREKSHPNGGEALVVVFVHGWKNDASLENEKEKNLAGFKQVLLQLAGEELRRGQAARPVVGVYMSWRGLSARGFLLKQLTFFSRKNAAGRVARVSFSHAIHRIVAKTKGTFDDCKVRDDGTKFDCEGNPDSIAVVVGHSFGGLIVENTLLRTLTVETEDFEAYGADLTVLVNPANEAVLARQSVHALENAPPKEYEIAGENVAMPLIVSITSVGDNATGGIFPVGMWVKGLFKKFRTYEDQELGREEQKYYYLHTPGHSCEFDDADCESAALYSHRVNCPLQPGGLCDELEHKKGEDVMERVRRMAQSQDADESIFPPPAVQLGTCVRAADRRHDALCIDRLSFFGAVTRQLYSVAREHESPNQTGYWIMPIPTSIVGDHSDIFQSELASLLAAFINLKQARLVDSLDEAETYMLEQIPEQIPGG